MADYTEIPDSALDPDAPLTSDLAYAWRDNPIAIAEGAPNAPKVTGEALGAVWRGFMTASETTTPSVLTGLDRVKKIMLDGIFTFGGSVLVRISFSGDGGGTWGAWQGFAGGVSGSDGYSKTSVVIDLQTGAVRGSSVVGSETGGGSASVTGGISNVTYTVPPNVNAIRIDMTDVGAEFGYNVLAIEGRV